MKLLIALLLFTFAAFACPDNCGQFVGGCESCHVQAGPYIAPAQEGDPNGVGPDGGACGSCNPNGTFTRLPARLDIVESVRSFVFGSLERKPSGNMTVRQHEELMRKALLFGVAQSPCPKLTPQTLQLIKLSIPRVQLASVNITRR